MAHVEHYKMADVKRIANEFTREKDSSGKPVYNNSDKRIDTSRSHLNYCVDTGRKYGMKTRSATTLTGVVKNRVNEVPHVNRNDLNVVSSWVITCPKELTSERDIKRFFEVAYKFCQDRYGEANVVNGYVHMDEVSPHMHVPVVPVKDNRISSKALFTRGELSSFHKDLERKMTYEFGMRGLVLNGRTKGNYTVKELKERTKQEQELADRQARIYKREQSLDARESSLKAQEDALSKLQEEIMVEQEKVKIQAKLNDERAKELELQELQNRRYIRLGKEADLERSVSSTQITRRLPDIQY